ncbi:MAG: transcription antitermination protein NusB [Bacteroidetes bacterium]|nr:MAG: transcription antitermination protein NusB [Bacteroidota bacterium]
MLNRRHLRIKVLQSLYAFFQSNEEDYAKAEKELMLSLDRIYDLYLYLLLTFEELRSIAEHRIEENKQKLRPSSEDLDPNLRFVNNRIFTKLESSDFLHQEAEKKKINWIGDVNREMFRKMFLKVRESENYISYMNSDTDSMEEDIQFACSLFKSEIANFPLLYNYFEEKSIHWLDDIDLACSMVLKTIKSAKGEEEIKFLPLFKDSDDEIPFVKTLFRSTIVRDEENLKLIDELTRNWELDRIAKMDVILMKMAITELQEFNNIPTKVTLNEYIEISKFYSTPKSNGFINGILDQAIERLQKEDKIKKMGRGLMN